MSRSYDRANIRLDDILKEKIQEEIDSERLLQITKQITKGVSETMNPLHRRMKERWGEISKLDPWYTPLWVSEHDRMSMIEDFGEDLRRAESDLCQRFQSVSDMLKAYAE